MLMQISRILRCQNLIAKFLKQAAGSYRRPWRWYRSLLASDDRPEGFEKFWRREKSEFKEQEGEKPQRKPTDSDDPPKDNREQKRDNEDRDSEREERFHKTHQQKEERQDPFRNFPNFGPPPGFGTVANLLLLMGLGFFLMRPKKPAVVALTEQAALDLVKSKRVAKALLNKSYMDPNNATVKLVGPAGENLGIVASQNVDLFLKQFQQVQLDAGVQGSAIVTPQPDPEPPFGAGFLSLLLFFVILSAILSRRKPKSTSFYTYMKQRMNPTNQGQNKKSSPFDFLDTFNRFSRSRATEYGPDNKINVTFKDVAGMEGCKEELQEVIDFLKHPNKYNKLGARIPKGLLLCGPPGTGKTLLAKACAGEAGVAFFTSSGSEFVEMFVGVGAARVRDLFARAKAKSPAVIFLDELDAIGKHRARMGFNDERESTLNQLFIEMDGFGTDTNVIVIAATNRKDSLDKALLRPGRFDRIIDVNLPTRSEREAICNVHLQKLVLSKEITKVDTASKLAALTMGMSGADLANICNEAALIAARKNLEGIDAKSFYDAYDRVLTGLRRKLPLTPAQKKTLAYHEAGHTVVGWYLKHAQPVLKVSIVPSSKGSLGRTIMLPQELELYSKEQLMDMVGMVYGGRAAEEVFLGTVTTGAKDDLEKATQLVKLYIGNYGMHEKFSNMSVLTEGGHPLSYDRKILTSAYASQMLDKAIQEVCQERFMTAKKLLEERKDVCHRLVDRLLAKETLEVDELTEILGNKEGAGIDEAKESVKDLKKTPAAQAPTQDTPK